MTILNIYNATPPSPTIKLKDTKQGSFYVIKDWSTNRYDYNGKLTYCVVDGMIVVLGNKIKDTNVFRADHGEYGGSYDNEVVLQEVKEVDIKFSL